MKSIEYHTAKQLEQSRMEQENDTKAPLKYEYM